MDRIAGLANFLISLKNGMWDFCLAPPLHWSGPNVSEPARRSSLDKVETLIDWAPIVARLDFVRGSARDEASWPPLTMFKAMMAVWHDV